MKRKPDQLHRCLISDLHFDRRRGVYLVDVLRVDGSLNFANKTGIGSTVVMTRARLDEAVEIHQVGTKRKLIGAPIICRVKFETGNVLGSSTFERNAL